MKLVTLPRRHRRTRAETASRALIGLVVAWSLGTLGVLMGPGTAGRVAGGALALGAAAAFVFALRYVARPDTQRWDRIVRSERRRDAARRAGYVCTIDLEDEYADEAHDDVAAIAAEKAARLEALELSTEALQERIRMHPATVMARDHAPPAVARWAAELESNIAIDDLVPIRFAMSAQMEAALPGLVGLLDEAATRSAR